MHEKVGLRAETRRFINKQARAGINTSLLSLGLPKSKLKENTLRIVLNSVYELNSGLPKTNGFTDTFVDADGSMYPTSYIRETRVNGDGLEYTLSQESILATTIHEGWHAEAILQAGRTVFVPAANKNFTRLGYGISSDAYSRHYLSLLEEGIVEMASAHSLSNVKNSPSELYEGDEIERRIRQIYQSDHFKIVRQLVTAVAIKTKRQPEDIWNGFIAGLVSPTSPSLLEVREVLGENALIMLGLYNARAISYQDTQINQHVEDYLSDLMYRVAHPEVFETENSDIEDTLNLLTPLERAEAMQLPEIVGTIFGQASRRPS